MLRLVARAPHLTAAQVWPSSITRLGRLLPARLGLILAVLALGAASLSAAEPQFTWVDAPDQGTCDLKLGDQPVVRYMYAYDPSSETTLHDTYKVYHHVFGPGTDQRITKGPGGEFTHHRGLFVAWNKTGYEGKSADFWHCTKGAHQRHIRFVDRKADAQSASMTSEIHWNDADGKPVIVEMRTLAVSKLAGEEKSPAGFGWQIDWTSRLESRRGTITLDGDRQHAGFQFRADQPVAEAKSGKYIRPTGFPEQLDAVQVDDRKDPMGHINLNWFALNYPLGENQYTVQYCENPSLPKPSRYSERPYGRFGAFFQTTLEADKPLELVYRVNVTRGETPSRETLQKRYDAFVADRKTPN
jgi:hypothetical protein